MGLPISFPTSTSIPNKVSIDLTSDTFPLKKRFKSDSEEKISEKHFKLDPDSMDISCEKQIPCPFSDQQIRVENAKNPFSEDHMCTLIVSNPSYSSTQKIQLLIDIAKKALDLSKYHAAVKILSHTTLYLSDIPKEIRETIRLNTKLALENIFKIAPKETPSDQTAYAEYCYSLGLLSDQVTTESISFFQQGAHYAQGATDVQAKITEERLLARILRAKQQLAKEPDLTKCAEYWYSLGLLPGTAKEKAAFLEQGLEYIEASFDVQQKIRKELLSIYQHQSKHSSPLLLRMALLQKHLGEQVPIDVFEKAVKAAKGEGDHDFHALANLHLGQAHLQNDNYQAALVAFNTVVRKKAKIHPCIRTQAQTELSYIKVALASDSLSALKDFPIPSDQKV